MRCALRAAALLALGFAAVAWDSDAAAQTVCPVATQAGTRVVSRLLSSPEYADTRQRHGLPQSSTTRTLNDAQDATACNRIYQFLATKTTQTDWRAKWNPSFYAAGGYYYVVLAPKPVDAPPPPPGTARFDLRWKPVYVLDSQFALVASLGM